MKQAFEDWRPQSKALAHVETVNAIIAEYGGKSLTCRQIFYQLVARGIVENNYREYLNNNRICERGRMAGLIDWDAIEDRTRWLRRLSTWSSPQSFLRQMSSRYRRNWWGDQDHYVEVWIEKDALIGVIEDVCDEWQVPYLAARGFCSQSAMYEASMRFILRENPVILYLGDHDPSGLKMGDDVRDRLKKFGCGHVEVVRLALNMDQIDEYGPPPNNINTDDARADWYQAEYGDQSWELDALAPDVISGLIETAIEEYVDLGAWERVKKRENRERNKLLKIKV